MRIRPSCIGSAAVYWRFHSPAEPAATGADGVINAVPLPGPATAPAHAAIAVRANTVTSHRERDVMRRRRITIPVRTETSSNRPVCAGTPGVPALPPRGKKGKVGANVGREQQLTEGVGCESAPGPGHGISVARKAQ